ncbi:MAG: DUF2157 domain-containing protein [Rhodobacterales bacterium]
MHIKSKSAVIGSALQDWRDRGLLDTETSLRLQADLEQGHRRFSFTAFVITAGVVCLCFAAMTFIAANWEEMSRLARLTLVILALWLAWGAALWAGLRGLHWWHEALMVLACGMFGAGIMLVSQIYHIQGNAADAVWLWGLGTLLAAVLARGTMVLVFAIGLFGLWHAMQIDIFGGGADMNLPYLGWWLAGAALAWWLNSKAAAHMSVIALCFWLLTALTTVASPQLAAILLALSAVTAISAMLASMSGPLLLRGFEGAALGYATFLLGLVVYFLTLGIDDYTGDAAQRGGDAGLAGLLLPLFLLLAPLAFAVAGHLRRWVFTYDLWVALLAGVLMLVIFYLVPVPLLPEAMLLAVFIWITRMGWRLDQRGLRIIGMFGFVMALLLIYAVTVGTLIGTSGFYLGAGVILLGGAWLATRLDPKRRSST